MSIDWLPDGPNAINGLILIAVIAIAILWFVEKVQDDEWLDDYDPNWPKTDEVYDQEKDDE